MLYPYLGYYLGVCGFFICFNDITITFNYSILVNPFVHFFLPKYHICDLIVYRDVV